MTRTANNGETVETTADPKRLREALASLPVQEVTEPVTSSRLGLCADWHADFRERPGAEAYCRLQHRERALLVAYGIGTDRVEALGAAIADLFGLAQSIEDNRDTFERLQAEAVPW